jgi:hypothetical protein
MSNKQGQIQDFEVGEERLNVQKLTNGGDEAHVQKVLILQSKGRGFVSCGYHPLPGSTHK